MSFNSHRNGENQKKKWEAVITVIALSLCTAGLLAISIVSYFQTMYAFLPLNDAEIPIIGGWIAAGMAFIFQYGQNAALYYKNHYATGRHVFTFLFWDVNDKRICNVIFGLCAMIDAGTNILWLNERTGIRDKEWYFQVIYYLGMTGVVFVEEVLGQVLQSCAHAYTELQKIMLRERSGGFQGQEKSEKSGQSEQQGKGPVIAPKSDYKPQFRPGTFHAVESEKPSRFNIK